MDSGMCLKQNRKNLIDIHFQICKTADLLTIKISPLTTLMYSGSVSHKFNNVDRTLKKIVIFEKVHHNRRILILTFLP